MSVVDFFNLEVLATSLPYIVVKHGDDVFTILDEGLGYPFYPDQDHDEQWLNWLVEFSVSINGITTSILQKHLDAQDRSNAENTSSQRGQGTPHAKSG